MTNYESNMIQPARKSFVTLEDPQEVADQTPRRNSSSTPSSFLPFGRQSRGLPSPSLAMAGSRDAAPMEGDCSVHLLVRWRGAARRRLGGGGYSRRRGEAPRGGGIGG